MQVLMKKTQLGVNDGDIHPQEYKEGEVYDIKPDLYRAFSGMGIISDVEDCPQEDCDYGCDETECAEHTEKEEKTEYETKVIDPKKTTKKKGGKNK